MLVVLQTIKLILVHIRYFQYVLWALGSTPMHQHTFHVPLHQYLLDYYTVLPSSPGTLQTSPSHTLERSLEADNVCGLGWGWGEEEVGLVSCPDPRAKAE